MMAGGRPALPSPAFLEDNWRRVLDEMGEAVRQAGRAPGEVRLVAVSKFHPAEAVAVLAALGQRDFGENYIREARAKQDYMALHCPHTPVDWHAIGPIQSNKAKDAAGRFRLIHSLASLKLAKALAARPERGTGAAQGALLQVNIGKEPQKSGVLPADLPALVEDLLPVPGISLQGLMCLPPNCGEGERARPYFIRLRNLRDGLEQRFGLHLPHLSMGMSGDFIQAIEEGATLIRVGTALFGSRS